jgi:hypothetical protein
VSAHPDRPPHPGPGLDPLRRRKLATRLGWPHLFPSSLAIAVALAGWALFREGGCGRDGLRRAVASPETQVREALAGQPRARLGDVYGYASGGTAVLDRVSYADVVVKVEGGGARVLAVVEAAGEVTWRDQRASLSYVGRESFVMRPCSVALWCADGGQFARLRAALTLSFRRLDAFRLGDLEIYGRIVSERYPGGKGALLDRLRRDLAEPGARRLTVNAWQIRVERDTATVGEDYHIALGAEPPRALRARYELAWEEGRWRIAAGL